MKDCMRTLPALLLAAVASLPAQAAIVKYEFTASVSSVTENLGEPGETIQVGSSNFAGPAISVGDTWTGTFFYDTNLVLTDRQPTQPEHGSYRRYQGNIAATITDARNGLTYDQSPSMTSLGLMTVRDSPIDMGSDSLSFDSHGYQDNGVSAAYFLFIDPNGNALSSATPPLTLQLEDFQLATVNYGFLLSGTANSMSALANITSLTRMDIASPVPEPSTYAMLGLGLAALAMTKRLRRA